MYLRRNLCGGAPPPASTIVATQTNVKDKLYKMKWVGLCMRYAPYLSQIHTCMYNVDVLKALDACRPSDLLKRHTKPFQALYKIGIYPMHTNFFFSFLLFLPQI